MAQIKWEVLFTRHCLKQSRAPHSWDFLRNVDCLTAGKRSAALVYFCLDPFSTVRWHTNAVCYTSVKGPNGVFFESLTFVNPLYCLYCERSATFPSSSHSFCHRSISPLRPVPVYLALVLQIRCVHHYKDKRVDKRSVWKLWTTLNDTKIIFIWAALSRTSVE